MKSANEDHDALKADEDHEASREPEEGAEAITDHESRIFWFNWYSPYLWPRSSLRWFV